MTDALCEPRPVQARLPILIGGSGPKKTLRTTARYADAWNTSGTAEELLAKDAVLRERCAEVGRDPEEIERTVSVDAIVRDDAAEAERVLRAARAGQGDPDIDWEIHAGSPERISDWLGESVSHPLDEVEVLWMGEDDPRGPGLIAVTLLTPRGTVRID